MVRSGAQHRVSNHGPKRNRCTWPSFETAASQPPRDEDRSYFFLAAFTCSAMKRGSAKAAACTSGVQYLVLKLPAFL